MPVNNICFKGQVRFLRPRYIKTDTEPTNKSVYTGCFRRNPPYFERTFLGLIYVDITKHTHIQGDRGSCAANRKVAGSIPASVSGFFH